MPQAEQGSVVRGFGRKGKVGRERPYFETGWGQRVFFTILLSTEFYWFLILFLCLNEVWYEVKVRLDNRNVL